MKKLNEYLEYKRNKKIAKREFAKMAAATLPVMKEVSAKATDIASFVIKLLNETKNVDGERLFEILISELSALLQTNNHRVIELLTYMAALTPQDMRKILVHSAVETMPDAEKKK